MTRQPKRQIADTRRPTDGENALPDDVLDQVAGGASNIMKTKHDTAKNTISNIH
jgi:hypothetical protein